MSNSPPTQGPALDKARRDAGLTVQEFAHLAGISIATYHNAAANKWTPNARTTLRIRTALEQLATCPRVDRISELEAKVDTLREQVQQLVDARTGAVA